MSKPAFPMALSLLACAFLAAPAAAQTAEEEPKAWNWESPDKDAPKTWYAMISIEQNLGPEGCDVHHYKVSTREPIKLQGPPKIRPAHGAELAAWFMAHLRETSPTAHSWFHTDAGHKPAQVYFRESAGEVMKAFAADGHFKRDRTCYGSVLAIVRTSNFHFAPPPEYLSVNFGNEPLPQNMTVTRDLAPVPSGK